MGEMISDESAYTQAFWSFPLIPIAYIKLVMVEIGLDFDLCMYLNAAVSPPKVVGTRHLKVRESSKPFKNM